MRPSRSEYRANVALSQGRYQTHWYHQRARQSAHCDAKEERISAVLWGVIGAALPSLIFIFATGGI